MQRKVVINSASTGKFTERNIGGRPHIVTSMVSISLDSVMNRVFYPAQAIRDSYLQLDRVPAPASHPKVDGLFVSANDPLAVNAYNVGAFALAPRIEGRHVVNDLAVDIQTAEKDPRGVELMRRIKEGEKIAVSTGLTGELTMVAGNFEGADYAGIISNIQFDHVAFLLDEPPAGESTYALNSGKELLICNLDQSVNTLRDQLDAALRERFPGACTWVADIELNPNAVIAEADGETWRFSFELTADETPVLTGVGEKVQRVVTYETQNRENTDTEGGDMDKDKLILAIIGNAGNSFTAADKAQLDGFTELELINALHGAVKPPAVSVDQARTVLESEGLTVNSADEGKAVAEFLANKDAFAAFQSERTAERTRKVEHIAGNSELTADDLAEWDDAKLERLYNSLAPVQDYSGKGAAPVRRSNAGAVAVDYTH